MIVNCDIYLNYDDVNADFATWVWNTCERPILSNDTNMEDPALIVGVRKWAYDNCGEKGPDFSFLGLTMIEHVRVHDKYDLFMYER